MAGSIDFDSIDSNDVWLVQVPKSVAVSDLEISENGASAGDDSYSLNKELIPDGSYQLLVQKSSGKYSPISVSPTYVVMLSKKVSLPKVDFKKVVAEKPRVPQKTGLRLRHYSTGYSGPTTETGTESTREPATSLKRSNEELGHDLDLDSVDHVKKEKKHKSDKGKKDKKDKKDKKEKKDKDKDRAKHKSKKG